MFKYEKEMIPILEHEFGKKYEQSNIVREFNSGNGIADLTIAIESGEKLNIVINNYTEMYYLIHFFNRMEKRIYPEKLITEKRLDEQILSATIKKLVNNDYLIKINDYYVVTKLYKPIMKRVFSIEAKLKKWKEAFYQALRYKCFSHKSYVALSCDKIRNVDIELLASSGIGLISVSRDAIKFILEPALQIPSDLTIYCHLTEKLSIYR